jgi:hypothetical protein
MPSIPNKAPSIYSSWKISNTYYYRKSVIDFQIYEYAKALTWNETLYGEAHDWTNNDSMSEPDKKKKQYEGNMTCF